MRRTFARLEVSSRSIYAVVEPGSCFAGSLLELALAADRVYMLDDPAASLRLSEMNFGALPTANGLSRLEARFYQDQTRMANLRDHIGQPLSASDAVEAGLVTFAPDELDWADELRLAIEGRSRSLSGRIDGSRSELAIWRSRNHAIADLRAALSLAELDFHSTQRGRAHRRAESLRHGKPRQIRLGASLICPK